SYLALCLLVSVFSMSATAQKVTITGNVQNASTSAQVPAVSITIKGTSLGTFTDQNGNFSISVDNLPVVLVISSIGYELQEVTVTDASQPVNVSFVPSSSLGEEVVVSASRVPERILESPVTVERVSAAAIRNAPA